MSKSDFLKRWRRFRDEHKTCPGTPAHLCFEVWLPFDSDKCSVTLTCICGTRVTIPALVVEGRAIVDGCKEMGLPVAVNNQRGSVH